MFKPGSSIQPIIVKKKKKDSSSHWSDPPLQLIHNDVVMPLPGAELWNNRANENGWFVEFYYWINFNII